MNSSSLLAGSPAPLLYSFPVLSGLVFGGMGWVYLSAARRRIPATALYVYLGLVGTMFFGWRWVAGGLTGWGEAPAAVWAWGVASGLSQCLLIWEVKLALERGPMSPLWCAMNLAFAPVIVVSAVTLGEPFTLAGAGALAAGVATVVIGSVRQHYATEAGGAKDSQGDSGPVERGATDEAALGGETGAIEDCVDSPPSGDGDKADRSAALAVARLSGRSASWAYGGLLVAALVSNSVMNIGIKVLGVTATASGATWMARFGDLFFLLVYGGILVPMGLAFGLRGREVILSRRCGALGLAAGICSVSALGMLGAAAALPAVYVFTVSCVISILLTGVMSVALFREKADRLWFAMMACSALSVALAGLAG